jgi:hypothetical protein
MYLADFPCISIISVLQLKAGEISLSETTTEESAAAKARLDAQRKNAETATLVRNPNINKYL